MGKAGAVLERIKKIQGAICCTLFRLTQPMLNTAGLWLLSVGMSALFAQGSVAALATSINPEKGPCESQPAHS